MGTPTHAYDHNGFLVWERELDIYGSLRKGDNEFVPFLYQGQYVDAETGLVYNRFRYYDNEAGNYISQDPIRLAGDILNFYNYVNDSNLWIDNLGLHFGSGKGQHSAKFSLYDENGKLIDKGSMKSGGMTVEERALGFPKSSLATHTEARITKNIPLSKGQRLDIIGQYPPCCSCKGKMRSATNGTGGIVSYTWMDDNGKMQIVQWQNNRKVVDSTSKNKKLHPKHH